MNQVGCYIKRPCKLKLKYCEGYEEAINVILPDNH
jgi:hypothetical protein